ncbi:MAG: hypothetical protein A2289_02235 [Deltaproteobacteria bacterium RIFOXYA12_FULL_58_15]|nr:MAG: hypothetical protein A2289_02235 [Deltaproteobacteria bacterium RIFOXYA12_FULL_58_15]OGR14424.1 MAG: hypothetical protein A2341_04725 [Deltaproteobacteria bacterium RIFOXYB12_FULL_58_9]
MLIAVIMTAALVPVLGWPGLLPLAVGEVVVVVWLHALMAAVEKEWAELKAVNWAASLPKKLHQRQRYVEELRERIVLRLRPAAQHMGRLLRVSLLIGVASFAILLVVRSAWPDAAASVFVQRQSFILAAVLFVLLLVFVGWSVLRLRRASASVGEVFAAIERALDY